MDLLKNESSSHILDGSFISLVNFIALNFFSEYYSTCIIRASTDDIELNFTAPSIAITATANFNETLLAAVDLGCQSFIVSERTLFTFLDAFVDVHDIADQRSANKRLMIIMDSYDQQFLDKITKHENTVELPNVLIVVPGSANASITLYTTKLSNNGTRSSKTVEIEPVYGSDYFPDKINNMNGVPIHLATVMYPPYTYYEETIPEEANARYVASFKEDIPLYLDGTEATMVIEFCRRYNCNVEASFDEIALWGNAYPNHTGTGMYGAVVERYADIALASLYYALEPYKFATYSHPMSCARETILVPKPLVLPPWRTPFLSFTLSLWVAVLVAFCVGVLAVWSIEKVRFNILQPDELPCTFSDAMLTMIGFYMEQNARMRTDLMSCTLLFTFLLFAGFMVGNSYSGGLAGVMTIPQYEKPIDTVFDLVQSGMIWGSHIETWIEVIGTSPQPDVQKLKKTFRVVSKDVLAKHTKTYDMGFIGERTEFNHFVPVDFIDSEASTMLQLLKDDLYWQPAVAIVTKTCPFLQKFDELILHVKESGIQNYWELQASNKYLHSSIQTQILNGRSSGSGDNFVKLTISHFSGAYMILVAGLGSAMLAFMFEIPHIRKHCFAPRWIRKRFQQERVVSKRRS